MIMEPPTCTYNTSGCLEYLIICLYEKTNGGMWNLSLQRKLKLSAARSWGAIDRGRERMRSRVRFICWKTPKGSWWLEYSQIRSSKAIMWCTCSYSHLYMHIYGGICTRHMLQYDRCCTCTYIYYIYCTVGMHIGNASNKITNLLNLRLNQQTHPKHQ